MILQGLQETLPLVGDAVRTDLVAHATDRSNQRPLITGIHLAAQIVDVHVHNIGHGVEIELPDVLNDGGSRDGVPLVPHQVFEQGKFFGTQLNGTAAALHIVCYSVDHQIINAKDCGRRPASPPQDSADARRQFLESKRFAR